MRHPLRLLFILLATVVVVFVVGLLLPVDRPVGPVEVDVTNELVAPATGG